MSQIRCGACCLLTGSSWRPRSDSGRAPWRGPVVELVMTQAATRSVAAAEEDGCRRSGSLARSVRAVLNA